jgi:hypothetical protein
MSSGNVIVPMRKRPGFIRCIEGIPIEQDAAAAIYATCNAVIDIDIAIVIEATDGHRQSDG